MSAPAPSLRELMDRLRTGLGDRRPAGALPEAGSLVRAVTGDPGALAAAPAGDGEPPRPADEILDLLGEGRLDGAIGEDVPLDDLERLGRALVAAAADPSGAGAAHVRERLASWLDAVRRTPVLQRIVAADAVDAWLELMLEAVDASRFTVATLLRRRTERYGPRTLFREIGRTGDRSHTWLEIAGRVDQIARGLLALVDEHGRKPIAILSENRIEMALVDLACLSTGLVDVMIPANVTEADALYILRKTGASILVVSTRQQLEKVEKQRAELPELRCIVLLDGASRTAGMLRLGDVVARGRSVPPGRLAEERERIDPRALATLMFTSGTTGRPKGIRFTQRNIVSKRFARALALPEIGDRDVFLCYLPLFHTFGRYLELMGTIFWGAVYVFLEDASVEALREAMRRVRPTVFISVPKKWIELWEEIGRRADIESASDETLHRITRSVVGDRLRWGLSAAGYLDPEIFRFFQRQGVELMSGFGMTEATGGITMTPPGRYRDDTLGLPLPGIEVKLDDDGEMMIRGPYITPGYYEDEEGSGLDPQGWLRTGDLMERDEAGYYRLVDRKKDIYKNIKGESVAPQRVENLFRDFEAVHRVFLVGDHRPYNTVLLVPNLDYGEINLRALSPRERREYFRSLVVSVNRFLAPFERIVDFAVLDRDFSGEREELTPKGTFRRKIIAANFRDEIEPLYRRARIQDPSLPVELHLPNWVFQAQGLTAGDVRFEAGSLTLAPTGASLRIEPLGDTPDGHVVRIGSCRYEVRRNVIDVGALLSTPALWLGNEQLSGFAALGFPTRTRRPRAPRDLLLMGRAVSYTPDDNAVAVVREAAEGTGPSLDDVDVAARFLGAAEDDALAALDVFAQALRGEEGIVLDMALVALRLAAASPSLAVRRKAFCILFPSERDAQAAATLERFLSGPDVLLDEASSALITEAGLSHAKLRALAARTEQAIACVEGGDAGREPIASSLLELLAGYGAAHPARFAELRAAVARAHVFARVPVIREEAARAFDRQTRGFREWLGPVQRIAVDTDEGNEYRWEDVVAFEDGIHAAERSRIFLALSRTNLLREALFLFTGEALVRLTDLPRGGVWVSRLGEQERKASYRVTAHTRLQGAFDLVLNLNRGYAPDELAAEIRWLLVTGDPRGAGPLVPKVGGYHAEYDLWSEEFLAGESLDRAVQRLGRRREEDSVDRLRILWPFFAWSAAAAYVDFWNRTGRRFAIARPSPADVVVPTHDYQTGTRVISVSGREEVEDAVRLLHDLWERLIVPLEERDPSLAGVVGPEIVVEAFLETIGVEEGIALLEASPIREGAVASRIEPLCGRVRREGFVPRRLRSAVDRYHRWAVLAADATPQAQARTVQELYETYRLSELIREFPESRIRFFRDTVFRDAPEAVARGLEEILDQARRRELEGDALVDRLTTLRLHMESGSPGEYFLARLTFPYLRPGDEAGFLSTEMGGVRQTDIVVSLEDNQGRPYRVRRPINPKEVGRLHRLFIAASLDVQFRPEHHYLVALSERGSIIGGIFYEVDEENRSAHLEKIVVAEGYRKFGVSDGLMNEFFNRLRAGGLETVTTGFFRPSYFYRFGFSVGRRQAGLVKPL